MFLMIESLFKVFCLTEVSSQFMQEKTTIFLFSLYRVLPVRVKLMISQMHLFSSIRVNYVRVDLVRVKGCKA